MYSQYVIVHYTDRPAEDISAALREGRASLADLDRFGIRYWVEPKEDLLDAAISNAILNHYGSDEPDGLIHSEGHVILAYEENSGGSTFGGDPSEHITVYLLVHHEKYSTYGGALEGVGGSSTAVAITFEATESGGYQLEEYWEPRMGAYYAADIRDKFPAFAADAAIMDQSYAEELRTQAYEKALSYLNSTMSLDVRIGMLLDEIQSEPAHSSNPDDYIRAHEAEYEELIAYGTYTLRYCFAEFLQGNQSGLRGHIMAHICREMIRDLGEQEVPLENMVQTGQDWFDGFCGYAQVKMQNILSEELRKHHPATFLLLQMLEESENR
jgi:hypothetical protein